MNNLVLIGFVIFLVFAMMQDVFGMSSFKIVAMIFIPLVVFFYVHKNDKELVTHIQENYLSSKEPSLFSMMVNNNSKLRTTLEDFKIYEKYDPDAYNSVVKNLESFMIMYAKFMMVKYITSSEVLMLQDVRKNIINTMYSFYIKDSKVSANKKLERIVDTISSITLRYIKILANKNDIDDFVNNPMAFNIHKTDSFEML